MIRGSKISWLGRRIFSGPADTKVRTTSEYRRDLVQFGLPYAFIVAVGFILSAFTAEDVKEPLYISGWLLGLVGVVIAFGHKRLWLVAPFLGFGAILLVRAGTDGLDAGIGPLVLLPAIAIAIYGSRGALFVILTAVVTTYGAVVIFGGDHPHVSTPAREDGVLTLITISICYVVHVLVSRMRSERALAASRGELVESLARITRSVATSADARQALCASSARLVGAEVCALLEPGTDGTPEVKGAVGMEPALLTASVTHPESITRQVLRTGEKRFISDLHEEFGEHGPEWIKATGSKSGVWEPVSANGNPIGVLVFTWRHRIERLDRLDTPVEMLADEASFAIARASSTQSLREQARTDSLTGTRNRRSWDIDLRRALDRARDERAPLCIALLDLDWFKEFNDTHGHLAGDRQLRATASAWSTILRKNDMLARFGGDEFSVVLADTRFDEAETIVERLRAVVPGGQTCSAGIAEWQNGESPESLMERVDLALYRAKFAGRNRSKRAV